jgi:FkbM family methyltransferase
MWKPWYIWRPRQLVVRAWRSWRSIPSGYIPIQAAWGGFVVANPATTVGNSLWTTGIHDLAASEVFVRLIPEGALVIDAGAHVGYITALAGAAAASGGSVLSFEPHPDLFIALQKTAQLTQSSSAARIILENAALGDYHGEARMLEPDGFDSNDGVGRVQRDIPSGSSIRIRIETIDRILGDESAALMKVDVEGGEYSVLCGAADALAAHRIRHVLFEDFDGSDSKACRLLASFGYRTYAIGWTMSGPTLRPASEGSLAKPYEAPSYLATIDSASVKTCCAARGWRVLRRNLGRSV